MDWYERFRATVEEGPSRLQGRRAIVHSEELQWQETGMARSALIAHPQIMGTVAETLMAFMAEIPPGGATGKHRHNSEAIIYILSGKGYSIFDEVRHDWKAGDTISPPRNAWHQHFNTDPAQPVRYLAVTNDPLLSALGLLTEEVSERLPLR